MDANPAFFRLLSSRYHMFAVARPVMPDWFLEIQLRVDKILVGPIGSLYLGFVPVGEIPPTEVLSWIIRCWGEASNYAGLACGVEVHFTRTVSFCGFKRVAKLIRVFNADDFRAEALAATDGSSDHDLLIVR